MDLTLEIPPFQFVCDCELFNILTVKFDLNLIDSFYSHEEKHLLKSIFNCPDICVK